MPDPILLRKILPIEDPSRYKMHLAVWNHHDHPLNVFVRDENEWIGWNRWRGSRNEFNRDYIFALIDFYPQRDRWLFGGIFQVVGRPSDRYEIELVEESRPFVGRLKLEMKRPGRSRSFRLENHYQTLIVDEILPEVYTGQPFSGFHNINLTFPELETLVAKQRADWKAALQYAKGVYLITDTSNNKRYVGSAYGDAGIWSRWQCYSGTAHGYNDGLCELIAEKGMDHARHHFTFALLEYFAASVDDQVILAREVHWKRVLLSQGDHGYNRN